MARNRDTINKITLTKICTGLTASCLASQVFAAGFQLLEQNVTNLGLAYSGTAALAEDASTNFFNAAGLTRLGESELVLAANIIQGSFDFEATTALSSVGTAISGSDDDPGTVNFVPAFYLSKRLDDRWIFGFGVSTPWGLNTDYDDDGVVRYLATETGLKTLNFSPSVAVQLLPCLSFGVGPDFEWGQAILETRAGTGDPSTDGFQKNRLSGWGYGWHAGVLWEAPWHSTRLGVNYRSDVHINGRGYSEILTVGGDTYFIEEVSGSLVLPDVATFSFYHAFNKCLALTGDISWTNWSRFEELRLSFTPDLDIDTVTAENWRDSMRYALGLIYTLNSNWLFRFGLAWDETPTRDETRTARIPDEDRFWIALGGAYTLASNFQIDFGYAHLFFKDASLNEFAPFGVTTALPMSAAFLSGEYSSSANIVGIQIRYDFV